MLQPPTWLLLSNTIPCAFCFPRSLLMPANYSLKFPSLLSAQFLGPAPPQLLVSNCVADKAAGAFLQGPGSETCPGNPSPDPHEWQGQIPSPRSHPSLPAARPGAPSHSYLCARLSVPFLPSLLSSSFWQTPATH